MPSRKPRRRRCVDQFYIDRLRYTKVLVAGAVSKIELQYFSLVVEIYYRGNSNGLCIFFYSLLAGFRCNAYQEMIGLYNAFAPGIGQFLFFVGIIVKFVRMPVLHQVPVNNLHILQRRIFANAQKFPVTNDLFHIPFFKNFGEGSG